MSENACIERATLKAYLLGWSSDEQSESIEEHLRECETCDRTVSELDGDPDTLVEFVGALAKNEKHSAPGARASGVVGSVDESQLDAPLDSVVQYALSRAMRLPCEMDGSQNAIDRPVLQIGPYELLGPLGRGGMGAVYVARHQQLGKKVAIKLLPVRTLRNEQANARFQREIRAAGKLSHPAIVSATDAGSHESTLYLVMELIDGMDLAHIARLVGPLEVADACAIVHAVAQGLSHAHAEGVVHRDVKPSNIMLSNSGQVKILDFGLAQVNVWDEVTAELTSVGQLMGTLDYMAPEQAERADAVDYRADLYALGATLFRLLCGRAPMAATPNLSPLTKLKLLAAGEAPSVCTLRPDIPTPLADLVRSLLARDPHERPASAAHAAERLAEFSAGANLPALITNARQLESTEPIMPESIASQADQTLHRPNVHRRANGNRFTWSHGMIALALASVLAIAGVLITLETNKGQFIVESDGASVEVALARDGQEVEKLVIAPGVNVTRLYAGKYQVTIREGSDQFVVDRQTIEILRGTTVVARITAKVPEVGMGSSASTATIPAASTAELQPGQRLKLHSLTDPTIKHEFIVHADRTIKVPLVGVVPTRGLTIESLQVELNKLYKPYFRNPAIEVYPDYSLLPPSPTHAGPVLSDLANSPMAAQPAANTTLGIVAGSQPSEMETELMYQGKTLTAWLDQFIRERQTEELKHATNAIYALANRDNVDRIADAMLRACPNHDSKQDTPVFSIISKAIPSTRALHELLVKQLSLHNQEWSIRVLQASPLIAFGARNNEQEFSIDELPAVTWLEVNVFRSKSDDRLTLAAADYLVRAFSESSLPISSSFKERIVDLLESDDRLGPDFWLKAPRYLDQRYLPFAPAFAQVKLERAMDVLRHEKATRVDVARAAMLINLLFSPAYDSAGINKSDHLLGLGHDIVRWLKDLRETNALLELASVEKDFLMASVPLLKNPLYEEVSPAVSIEGWSSTHCIVSQQLLKLIQTLELTEICRDEVERVIDSVAATSFETQVFTLGGDPLFLNRRRSSLSSVNRGSHLDIRNLVWPQISWRRTPSPSRESTLAYCVHAQAIAVLQAEVRERTRQKEIERIELRWCEERAAELDRDEDGQLSLVEAKVQFTNLKSTDDADGNGTISSQELRAALKTMSTLQAAPRNSSSLPPTRRSSPTSPAGQ